MMTCPECGARTFENFTVALVMGEWQLEIHTHHCVICGWVTVQDWQWLSDEDGGDE